jgi:hypothetical protein
MIALSSAPMSNKYNQRTALGCLENGVTKDEAREDARSNFGLRMQPQKRPAPSPTSKNEAFVSVSKMIIRYETQTKLNLAEEENIKRDKPQNDE